MTRAAWPRVSSMSYVHTVGLIDTCSIEDYYTRLNNNTYDSSPLHLGTTTPKHMILVWGVSITGLMRKRCAEMSIAALNFSVQYNWEND